MVEILFMCFAVPLAIITGAAIPIIVFDWLSKRM